MDSLRPSPSNSTIPETFRSTATPRIPAAKQSCLRQNIMARRAAVLALTSLLLSSKSALKEYPAMGGPLLPELNFNMVAPDQTFVEAMSEVRGNAEFLRGVKSLLDSESWGEAQRELRRTSALLKKDIYTIIQNKLGDERPRLRKLYSDLFNGVTKLDYAARDGDKARVWECYGRISEALGEILSRL